MRFSAIRIKHLPPGKVQFETLMEKSVEGLLTHFYIMTLILQLFIASIHIR